MTEVKLDTFEVMPPEVFKGGCGHIVLCQEWSTQKEESYLRVMIAPEDAERVASEILAIARRAK
jgi:hypothetical protein